MGCAHTAGASSAVAAGIACCQACGIGVGEDGAGQAGAGVLGEGAGADGAATGTGVIKEGGTMPTLVGGISHDPVIGRAGAPTDGEENAGGGGADGSCSITVFSPSLKPPAPSTGALVSTACPDTGHTAVGCGGGSKGGEGGAPAGGFSATSGAGAAKICPHC